MSVPAAFSVRRMARAAPRTSPSSAPQEANEASQLAADRDGELGHDADSHEILSIVVGPVWLRSQTYQAKATAVCLAARPLRAVHHWKSFAEAVDSRAPAVLKD